MELVGLRVDLHIRMLEALLFFLRKERRTSNIRLSKSTLFHSWLYSCDCIRMIVFA